MIEGRTDYEPDVIIYPFHGRYPGEEPLFHTRCSKHPGFTLCDSLTVIGEVVEHHLLTKHGSEPKTDV